MDAPRDIPDDMKDAFTLNGQIPIYEWYFNQAIPANTVKWPNEYLQSYIDSSTPENIKKRIRVKENYKDGAILHVQAFEKYMDAIKNKKVAVIGSVTPWIEAILVNCGAKEVITVEYNVPVCNHEIIKTISYTDFCKSSEKYDAIVSYSSIEHSGLGRYGDPLNPSGDIETMEHIYRSLVVGGLCFLGIPVGKDSLVWNAHRIYGELRLKLMYLDKFKEIEWVGCDKDYIRKCSTPTGNPDYTIQPIIVLQKPSDSC
jgi:hypothetical protein